jgi:hypothetical protein
VSKLNVECWVYPGKLGRSEPSICLFHATKEAEMPMLEALSSLRNGDAPRECSFAFADAKRERSITKLIVRVLPPSDELHVMCIEHAGSKGTIEVTDVGLELLITAVGAWLTGSEDFGVSPEHCGRRRKRLGPRDRESGELWFWGPDVTP